MKKMIFLLIIVASLMAALTSRAQFQEYFSSQSGGTNISKCNVIPEFTNSCPPVVNYYQNSECSESKSYSATNGESGSYTYDATCVCSSEFQTANGCSEIQTSASGGMSFTFANGAGSASGSANLTNGWTVIRTDSDGEVSTNSFAITCVPPQGLDWTTTYNYNLWFGGEPGYGGSSAWDGGMTETFTETQQVFNSTINYGDAPYYISGSASSTTTLSGLIPTSDLFVGFQLQSDGNSGSSAANATMTITPDQSSVIMTGARLQVEVQAPAGQSFTIPYVLEVSMEGIPTNEIPGVYIPATNIFTTNYITGVGTGTVQNYPSGMGIAIAPPYAHISAGCADPFYYGGSASITILNWVNLCDNPDKPCDPQNLSCSSCNPDNADNPDGSLNPIDYTGMPKWWVSEPYINLWAADRPVEYTTSLGEKVNFTMTYKQRDTRPWTINGQQPFLPIDGWNNGWYSYIHFTAAPSDGSCFSNWTATVYEPNGGELSFSAAQTQDPNSGDQLLPMDGVNAHVYPLSTLVPTGGANVYGGFGFRIVHSDGSQDVYGMVSPLYPSSYTQIVPVSEGPADGAIPLTWTPAGIIYGGGGYESIEPQEVGTCLGAVVGLTNFPATSLMQADTGWPARIVNSVTNYLPVVVTAPPSADAVLTEHIDPLGNSIHFNYATNGVTCQLQSVVDYDGLTTSLTYDTNGYLSSVQMPYGRTATFHYAASTNSAQLLSVTDAQGMTSSFGYEAGDGFMSTLITPYGSTTFSHFEVNPGSVAKSNDGVTRAIQITNPDGSGEMYAFFNSNKNAVPASYPSGLLPTPPSRYGLDNGQDGGADSMYFRNSYYWGRSQFARLSVQNPAGLNALTPHDFLLGRMSHWKLQDDGQTIGDGLGVTQEASPDGVIPGQMTWYGGIYMLNDDNDAKPTIAMRLLPDGTTWYQQYDYDDYAELDNIADARGTLLNYGFTSVTYTQIAPGLITNSWAAEWQDSAAWPGRSFDIDNSTPDQITITTNVPTAGGGVVGFQYTYPHWNETLMADATGAVATNFYNLRGQVTGSLQPSGLTTTNLYASNGFLAESIALEIRATNRYTFTNGLLATRQDPAGLLTGYTWDNLERPTGIYFPDGTSLLYDYTYLDLTGRKDRLGNWRTAQFDELRRMTSATDRNGNTTTFGYCICGGLATVTDPLTNTTSYDRNLAGWVTNVVFANAGGQSTSRSFTRDLLGRKITSADSTGLALSYLYDDQGLVTNVSSMIGSTEETLFSAEYDLAGTPLMAYNAEGNGVTNSVDGAERPTQQVYGAGITHYAVYSGWRRTQTSNPLGNSIIYYGYDPVGRLAATADYYRYHTNGLAYTPAGRLAALANGNGQVTAWTNDIYGRMIAKTDGNGVRVETNGYNPNGWLTAHWTPAGGLTHYTYDNNGNRLTTVYSSGLTIAATYDALNRLTRLSDAVGTSAFTYTNFGAFLGAPLTESGPFGSDTLTRRYVNRVPQGLTLAQPSGNWTNSYAHDSVLRLTNVTSSAGSFGCQYYGAGRQIQTLSLPGGNSIAESFDGAGQLLNTTLAHGSSALDEYSYAYDGAGHRTSVQRVDGATVNYGYDDIGEVTSAVGYDPGGSPQRANEDYGYGYDPAENLLLRTNNTLIQGFESDNANELVSVTRDNNLLTVAGSVSNNVTSLAINGQAAALYHDGTYAVAGGVALADGLNIITGVVTVAGITRTNQMNTALPVTVNLRYDANGNLIWDGWIAYGYDGADELTSVTVTNGWRTQYAYDGLGRRRVRTDYAWQGGGWVPTNGVWYVYDGMAVVQERTTNNVPVVTYTRGVDLSGTMQGAGGIGGLLARTDGNGSAFYHCDGNGNVTALVNSSGTVVAKYLYDSFGNTLGTWGALAAGNTYRYSSKEVDLRGGAYYYGYRWYQPNLQRWLSRDPLGEAGGINLYEFADNNSINKIDPFGNQVYPYGPNAPSTWGGPAAGPPAQSVPPGPSDPNVPSMGPGDPNAAPYAEAQQTVANDGLLIGSDLYGTQLGNDIAGLNAALYSPLLPSASVNCLIRAATPLTRGQLAATISPAQQALLKQLFGTGPAGAQDSLAAIQAGAQIPNGLTIQTLQTYQQIAQMSIDAGIDGIGTQAARLQLINAILNVK